ncbi:MAG TPA: TetR/AcrR family transcriptional regulator [Acidimicrobiales bacterium]|nr:TetR/AcrR family transcriptional regulator [Acidimicrobiales bacterium]
MRTPGRPLPDEPLHLPSLAQGLPPVPDAALDRYLDAAASCFARYGIGRTSVPDIARELGISRTTVYRQLGTVEQAARLLLARDLHRFLAHLPVVLDGATGPRTVIRLVAAATAFARGHPVLAKVLADEPELIGPFLTAELPDLVTRVSTIATPLLERAMRSGLVHRRDPAVLAEFLVRITISLVLAPPEVDTEAFLDEAVLPVLAP